MRLPDWVKPAVWGIVGGAIVAIIVGFAWGGWVDSVSEQYRTGVARACASVLVEGMETD